MKKEKYSKGEIAKIVLKTIAGLGLVAVVLVAPGIGPVLSMFNLDGSKDRKRYRRTVDNLKKQKYINLYNEGGKNYLEITKKGQEKIKQFDYEDLKIEKPKKWDGMWRLVIFDIPEKKKKIREEIRLKLEDMGFYQIQKSAFIYPHECRDQILFIKNYWFLYKSFDYLLVKSIDTDKDLKKHFKIR
jgi:phenylacetic acid degradation operon negative regulatory protein